MSRSALDRVRKSHWPHGFKKALGLSKKSDMSKKPEEKKGKKHDFDAARAKAAQGARTYSQSRYQDHFRNTYRNAPAVFEQTPEPAVRKKIPRGPTERQTAPPELLAMERAVYSDSLGLEAKSFFDWDDENEDDKSAKKRRNIAINAMRKLQSRGVGWWNDITNQFASEKGPGPDDLVSKETSKAVTTGGVRYTAALDGTRRLQSRGMMWWTGITEQMRSGNVPPSTVLATRDALIRPARSSSRPPRIGPNTATTVFRY